MKISIFQLPVPSHRNDFGAENIPLAASYITEFTRKIVREIDIVPPPWDLVNQGSDAAIVHWIESERPDLVGFSCYVWNVDRAILLAKRIKKRFPHILVVFGGPEVAPDNLYLLSSDAFDVGVVGEGEETFADMVRTLLDSEKTLESVPGLLLKRQGRWQPTSPRKPIVPLDRIPSPYLSGALEPSPAQTMILETVRGCPYRCTYCFYHKTYPHPRPFESDRIRRELFYAAENGVSEVYFLDPCFARRPQLPLLLRYMAEARNLHPIRFQAELNAEDCSAELIRSLADAGLHHVEVGLQSTNPRALKAVGRRFDRALFLENVRAMRNEGIHVLVDVMVGLPGDTVDDVKRSLDFVVENELYDDISLYPLCVLPGTTLRRQASRLGIHFQPMPPYHVLQTPHMKPEDIRHAFEYAESITGIDFFPVEIPEAASDLSIAGRSSYTTFIDLTKSREPGDPSVETPKHRLASHLLIRLDPCRLPLERPYPARHLRDLLEENPSTVLTLLVDAGAFQWASLEAFAEKIRPHPSHVLDREYFSLLDPIRSCQILVQFDDERGGKVLLRLPWPVSDGRDKRPGLRETSDQAWVGFPPGLTEQEEDAILEKIWETCPGHIRRFRLGSVEDL